MKHLILLTIAVLGLPFMAWAQEDPQQAPVSPVTLEAQAELMSNYVWRGIAAGHPYAAVTMGLGWHGLQAQVFGLNGLGKGGSMRELDLTLCYQWKWLSVGVNDYWDNTGGTRYFSFGPQTTGHTLEAFAAVDFGPVALAWNTHVAGADLREDGSRCWSSYVELTTAPLTLASFQFRAELGITPWASDYYGTEGFAVCNVGLSTSRALFDNGHIRIPLVFRVVANPARRDAYVVIGTAIELQ